MKMGLRTPNLKKSFKAKTVGKYKRAAKRAINPVYGKKGAGFLKNPKKAIYNNLYQKTTVDGLASVKKASSKRSPSTDKINSSKNVVANSKPQDKKSTTNVIIKDGKVKIGEKFYSKKSVLKYRLFFLICGWIIIICGCFSLPIGFLPIGLGIFLLICANAYKKIASQCN